MLFAIFADVWIGRYKTLIIGLLFYLCGCMVMLVTSLPFALDRHAGLPGLLVSMTFIALGAGAVKSTYFPLLGQILDLTCTKALTDIQGINTSRKNQSSSN
jgi:POT family proton-dependent oligopeptide transporter